MINKKDILILDMSGSPLHNSFSNIGYCIDEPYKKRSRLYYRLRAIVHLLRLDKTNWFDTFFALNDAMIKKYRPQLIIIIGSLIYEPFLRQLRTRYPNISVAYSFSNIVIYFASINPAILEKYNVKGFSWDKDDCAKYNLIYQTPGFDLSVFSNKINSDICYDACFIGADKGRYKLVKAIESKLINSGFKTYIHITPDYGFTKILHKDYKDKIPYKQYLEVVASSKCIIDFVQKGQVGTTMRTMEAIFSGKKLISNNARLKEYTFYHPNNIFIVDKDNIDLIPHFLKTPYIFISEDILQKYSLESSIQTIIYNELLSSD